jgi:hypothetical protein
VNASPETFERLISLAETTFGSERANELRSDIEQIAADMKELSAAAIDFDDEP